MSHSLISLLHLLKDDDEAVFTAALNRLKTTPIEFMSAAEAAQVLGVVEDTEAALAARKAEAGSALQQLRQSLSAASAYGTHKAPRK